ncbi:TQO small subunit DoxD [Clostridium magnum]|uniref:TQO small subunit DoxD n=1 Tax=Clostridium magnum DSM 2767 TaxID=1121326 RepID=A0A168DTP1_9CLOT|nr:TQO small subunit DoxD [Clostridium magnum]KZL91460.1 TQO small subunit DoxD [Clostridium magnum DSM 2767]SHH43173.1 thiosulfate dehydrogenase [quinone] large subunit [Clostridium magnum DSM 2767]
MKIFRDKRFAALWIVLRIWLGYQWLSAGMEKISSPVWVGDKAGVAVTGFLKGALAKATGDHPLVQGWYANFVESVALPNATVFSYLVAYGEVLVGISLILGALTIVGLLGGAFMNLNYMFAGTTSTNPNLYTVAILLMAAGANAYLFGLDRFILPKLSKLFNKNSSIKTAT